LTPIGLPVSSSVSSSSAVLSSPVDSQKSQVLLVLGGLPLQSDDGHKESNTVSPWSLVCTWQPSTQERGEGDEAQGSLGRGQGRESQENGENGNLKIEWRKLDIESASDSWSGVLGGRQGEAGIPGEEGRDQVGWIGHTACEDYEGQVLVFGGTACTWQGLVSGDARDGCPSAELSASPTLLRLRLRQASHGCDVADPTQDLMLQVEEMLPVCSQGGEGEGPRTRFAHASCVVKGSRGEGVLVVQGGCVFEMGVGNVCEKFYLMDLETHLWRSLLLSRAADGNDRQSLAVEGRGRRREAMADLAMVSVRFLRRDLVYVCDCVCLSICQLVHLSVNVFFC